MIMTYEQAKHYLTDSLRFGIKLGLHRMQRLMQLLDNPQEALRFFHIAGTNGKGSVSCYLASILAAGGHKTGLFTSPYIQRLTERVRIINGSEGLLAWQRDETAGEIAEIDFARIMAKIKHAVEQMIAEGEERPTEFELLTALAFCYFKQEECDLIVLETGLGGRLDSTNIIQSPIACAITALGYDHMDRLGPTLQAIAAEKAGIIKQNTPVYLYDPAQLDLTAEDCKAANFTIAETCERYNAPLHLISATSLTREQYDWQGQSFFVPTVNKHFHTRLLGYYQPINALMALRMALDAGLVSLEQTELGIASARWPARMELLKTNPRVLIDGAHNVQSCQALSQTLNRLLPNQKLILIMGMLADKEVPAMLKAVIAGDVKNGYNVVKIICTQPDNPRALSAADLAEESKRVLHALHDTGVCGYNNEDMIYIAKNPTEAASYAASLARNTGYAVCAFGSLYLMGELRTTFLRL